MISLENTELNKLREINLNLQEQLESTKTELINFVRVFNQSDNGVTIISKDGTIEYRNEAFKKMFRDFLKEIYLHEGQNISELGSTHTVQQHFNDVLIHNKTIIYNVKKTNPEGEVIWVQTTLSPIMDSNNNVYKVLAIDSDITKIKKAEEEINIQKEKIEIEKLKLKERNKKLWESSMVVHREKEKVEDIKTLLEIKNKNITDSIVYAQRIQQAALPKLETIKKVFTESFVLFKPKDIVSGDFYWFSDRGEYCYIAAVDCTGHGVPGAFMSMIGMNFLNNIVNEKNIASPAEILRELDNNIISALKQDSNESSKDGMDMAICKIDVARKTVTFSGANRMLLIARNNTKEIEQVNGDKYPIGSFFEIDKIFTDQEITLESGESIYFFTDGYADQFGGIDGKKLMMKRFRNILLDIQQLDMQKQHFALDRFHHSWQGAREQIDDILVVGIRL